MAEGAVEVKEGQATLYFESQKGVFYNPPQIPNRDLSVLALRRFVETLTETFAHIRIGLAIFDREQRLGLFNPAFAELMRLDPAWLAARPDLPSVLEQLRVPGAATIIADCRPLNAAARERLDYTGIVGLSHEVGILSTDAGRNSFAAQGIAI